MTSFNPLIFSTKKRHFSMSTTVTANTATSRDSVTMPVFPPPAGHFSLASSVASNETLKIMQMNAQKSKYESFQSVQVMDTIGTALPLDGAAHIALQEKEGEERLQHRILERKENDIRKELNLRLKRISYLKKKIGLVSALLVITLLVFFFA